MFEFDPVEKNTLHTIAMSIACADLLADGPGFPGQNTNAKNSHSIAGSSVTCMKSLATPKILEV